MTKYFPFFVSIIENNCETEVKKLIINQLLESLYDEDGRCIDIEQVTQLSNLKQKLCGSEDNVCGELIGKLE